MFSITDVEEMKRIFHEKGFVTTYALMKQCFYNEEFYFYLQHVSFTTLMLSQQDKNFSRKCCFKCPGEKNSPIKMYVLLSKKFF